MYTSTKPALRRETMIATRRIWTPQVELTWMLIMDCFPLRPWSTPTLCLFNGKRISLSKYLCDSSKTSNIILLLIRLSGLSSEFAAQIFNHKLHPWTWSNIQKKKSHSCKRLTFLSWTTNSKKQMWLQSRISEKYNPTPVTTQHRSYKNPHRSKTLVTAQLQVPYTATTHSTRTRTHSDHLKLTFWENTTKI